ncbi:hypothetical protein INT45_013952, partial [Circinella minor]
VSPLKNSPSYSCGALYLSILNLPRSQRNLPSNILLIGTLPGPKEPSNHQMNYYMEPLVKELEKLYKGVPVSNDPNSPNMRVVLLSIPGSTLCNWGGFDFPWQDRDEAKNSEGAEKWKAARTL